jgi:hypothetical protein
MHYNTAGGAGMINIMAGSPLLKIGKMPEIDEALLMEDGNLSQNMLR